MSTPAPAPVKEEPKAPEPKPASNPIVDSLNVELYAGDSVLIEATVLEVSDKSLKVKIGNGAVNATVSVPPSLVKKTFTPRIGAAPTLRTPVVEIPHPLGGVVPVPAYSQEAKDFQATGKVPENLTVEGLPNSSPQVQKLEAETSKTPSHSESPAPSSKLLP